jgi:hypothetical protein
LQIEVLEGIGGYGDWKKTNHHVFELGKHFILPDHNKIRDKIEMEKIKLETQSKE